MTLKTFSALQIPPVHHSISISRINLVKHLMAQALMLVKAVIIVLAATTLRAHYLLRFQYQSTLKALKAHMGAILLICVPA